MELGNVPRVVYSGARNKTANISHASGYHFRCREVNIPLFFMTLEPQKLVFGTSGFRRYFGALMRDDLVVFENIEYGNAVYVMFEEWEELSKKSRIDLLSGKYGESFERVLHTSGWKSKLRSIIKGKLTSG